MGEDRAPVVDPRMNETTARMHVGGMAAVSGAVSCSRCQHFMTLAWPAPDVTDAVRRLLVASGQRRDATVLEAECPNGHRTALVMMAVSLLDRSEKNALLSTNGGGG